MSLYDDGSTTPSIADPRPSRASTVFWRVFLRTSPHPVFKVMRRFRDVGTVGEIAIVGRKSGRDRHFLLVLIKSDGHLYIGHPNGDRAQWTRNLLAAGRADIVGRDGTRTPVVATRLPRGAERDTVIRMTSGSKPFPSGLFYRLSRRHVLAGGAYFRLDPVAGPSDHEGSA